MEYFYYCAISFLAMLFTIFVYKILCHISKNGNKHSKKVVKYFFKFTVIICILAALIFFYSLQCFLLRNFNLGIAEILKGLFT